MSHSSALAYANTTGYQTLDQDDDYQLSIAGEPLFPDCNTPEICDHFRKQTSWCGCKDLVFLFLFIAQFVFTIAIAGQNQSNGNMALPVLPPYPGDPVPDNPTCASTSAAYSAAGFGCVLLVFVVLGFFFVNLPFFFVCLTWVTVMTFLIVNIAVGLNGSNDNMFALASGSLSFVILFFLWSFFDIFTTQSLRFFKTNVEQARAIISGKIGPTSQREGIIKDVLLCTLIVFIIMVIWFIPFVAAFSPFFSSNAQGGASVVPALLIVFSYIMTVYTLSNALHCGISGAVASLYFTDASDERPSYPGVRCLLRGLTVNLGSCAAPSLFCTPFWLLGSIFNCCYKPDSNTLLWWFRIWFYVPAKVCSFFSEIFSPLAFTNIGLRGDSFYQGGKTSQKYFDLAFPELKHSYVNEGYFFMLNAAISIAVATILGAVVSYSNYSICATSSLMSAFAFSTILFTPIRATINTMMVLIAQHPVFFKQNLPDLEKEFFDTKGHVK